MESSFSSSKTQTPNPSTEATISTTQGRGEWNPNKPLCQYEGFWYREDDIKGIMQVKEHFKAQPNDIILCSFPKTGTTWLKGLAYAILNRSLLEQNNNNHPLVTNISHDLVPFLELIETKNLNHNNQKTPLFGTHLPYNSLPKSILGEENCKVIYVCRDPKDVFVSLWLFYSNNFKSKPALSMERAFELFCEGVNAFGPYLDHVLGFWKAHLECPEKIMFLKYEDLKKETSLYVKKLAEFMGYPFSLEEEREEIVQKIIDLCSFEKMSNLQGVKDGMFRPNSEFAIEKKFFFRKGEVGDWKNHISPEMGHRLDQITRSKLDGSGLTLV